MRTYCRDKQNKKKEPKVRQNWQYDWIKEISKKYKNLNKKLLCSIFKIWRSSFYYKKKRNINEEILKTKIKVIQIFDPYYWQRRVALHLWIDIKTATKLMQRHKLYGKVRPKRKFTKPGDKNLPHMWVENIKKETKIVWINQVWSSDFTHLFYKDTEFYLATVLDEYSKKIVGYTISSHHEKEIVFSAIQTAIEKENTCPEILHSDQWSEYRSYSYFLLLKQYGIIPSMSGKASPWQNWAQESFYWKFKLELWNLNRFNSIEEAIESVHLHIYYYNNERIHTTIKMAPQQLINQQKVN